MESPDYCHNPTFYNPQSTPEKHTKSSAVDHFIIDDLLDFSHEDEETILPAAPDGTVTGNSTDSSNLTVVDSCNSPFSGSDPPFSANFPDSQLSSELCVPFDDIAELEWLSNFVEESFSTDDLQKMQLISGVKPKQTNETTVPKPSRDNSFFRPDMMSVPGKARSKRNRSSTCNWSSRLLALSSPTTSSSETDVPLKKSFKATPKKKEFAENSDGRKCLHCSTDKTPQWRTGPMGPKTLCNACGVRYKSGRLVPEYRPAASPTFMLTRHSNSHRKVLELRRQKEMHMSQQFLYPHGLFDVSGADCDDFLIHHQTGQDYRQLI